METKFLRGLNRAACDADNKTTVGASRRESIMPMRSIMKFLPLLLMLFISCVTDKKQSSVSALDDRAAIEHEIIDFHRALRQAYNGVPLNTDSLMDQFFGKNVYYVTYWGMTEPIDSTKARLRHALPFIKDYESRLENISIKVYGDGAFAFFILRQTYTLNGVLMDEYLPTTFVLERQANRWIVVHSHRSADFQTIQQLIAVAQRH